MKHQFSQYVSRSQMETFVFGDCRSCRESVIYARVRNTQQTCAFKPQPVGGTELDRAYERHSCPKGNE